MPWTFSTTVNLSSHQVMEIGDFDLVSQAFMDASFKEQSESTGGFMGTGLSVKPVDTNVIGAYLSPPCISSVA